ncbi:NCS1 family nucleobase:cation symporter-1 [Gracilibacillus thailandensis]|uniref:Nitrate reductase n=1 Tax=Gracilibacillus thailandensis TaxID=563735 RepID=A0A6N7R308_9BACI|nr:cytosine permease [Gracilibacillus thailandensis]MRI66126.1 nitrate reductase [Gracilibacillus thailandensis]
MSEDKVLINGMKPDPKLYNYDLSPMTGKNKQWTWKAYAALWMGIVHNIVAWEVAANLIVAGMSFWQAFACVASAYMVAFIAILFNSYSGSKYGTPFPVLIRASFGTKGSQIPVFIRAMLGVFWFGIHLYLGSIAVNVILGSTFQTWESLGNITIIGLGLNEFIAFIIAFLIHAYVIKHGMERVRKFEQWAGPIIMIISVGLVIWGISAAGGISNVVNLTPTIAENEFWSTFFLSMTALIGTVATLILNISDLTRFSKSQKDHMIGQGIGMPTMFIFFSLMALVTTVGTMNAFGEPITNPIYVLAEFDNPFIVIVGAASILIATISTNIATNGVAVGYDLTNLLPEKLNFQRSGMIALIVGAASAPWLWYEEGGSLDTVLGGIGATMGPVLGIMLIDFFVIRRMKYDVGNLYTHEGIYGGWNKKGLLAFIIGMLFSYSGLIIPTLGFLYNFNWFLGVGASALAYLVLMWSERKVDVVDSEKGEEAL